jgi:hypothetical protein
MIWRSMDDLPDIPPEHREMFSVLLSEILVPADTWPYIPAPKPPEEKST